MSTFILNLLHRPELNPEYAEKTAGGGFAGTIQAFVPTDMLEPFCGEMEAVLGEGACHVLSIRPLGGVLLEERK